MNKENTQKLFDDFPSLYRGKDEPPSQNLMCFGFECGDGWFQLIYDLSKQITEICLRVKAAQVKEKFGTLRFYVEGVQTDKADEIYKLIEGAEVKSGVTCELCGSEKNVKRKAPKGGYWIRALCPTCREEEEKRRNKE